MQYIESDRSQDLTYIMNSSSMASTDKTVLPSVLGRGRGIEFLRSDGGPSRPGLVVTPGARECSVAPGDGPVPVTEEAVVMDSPGAA